ncbi:homocysteine S-methyltransferase family protein [Leucobacter sp. NPDC077196]|uniref:homocysteine S-methyltransferase family protein n=1 Tax=Leucobacter sp. NPDC077196 TaxID=3154959 RepID=UPI003431A221
MTIFVTDGGIETALTDRLGQQLPEFAAFVLLDSAEGRIALREYYLPFWAVAREHDMVLVLDTPTWRANADWGDRLGYDAAALAGVNADAVAFVRELDEDAQQPTPEVIVNGCIGPRFDDYVADQRMSAENAEAYHSDQVRALAEAGADRVTSVTTFDAAEGIGVVRAAVASRIPVFVSFIVGADGSLADGSSIADAIAAVDRETDAAPEGFLINCAHPSEVATGIARSAGAVELDRIVGFRLNAAATGDTGAGDEPRAFAEAELELRKLAPLANVFGGCCGTDAPHIAALAELGAPEAAVSGANEAPTRRG